MEGYIAEVRYFAGNFAPVNWLFCNGALLNIADYEVLFVLIGTTFGGDGVSTFALPNMCGRVGVGGGLAPGLMQVVNGQSSGTETTALTTGQLPSHTHTSSVSGASQLLASATSGDVVNPTTSSSLAAEVDGVGQPILGYNSSIPDKLLNSASIPSTGLTATNIVAGGNTPHNNMQPYLVVNFIICWAGVFPSQN